MGQIENDVNAIINELPGEIYQETLKDIIKKNFSSPLDTLNIEITAASALGDNYLGILYRVSIKDLKGRELRVVIKLPPTSAARREQFFARPSFLRESEFYDKIYPMLRKFQEDKGIDVGKDGFHQAPSCYRSLTEDLLEGLFLEDLKVTGFEMFDRFKEVTAEHVYRLMEALGKLHALSFAIKDQKPELLAPFKEMVDIFLQGSDSFKEQMNVWFESMKKKAADVAKESSNENLKARVSEALKLNFMEMVEPNVSGLAAEPYAVICHGDCWNNNMMFRNENGIPVDIRLLDWQIMRYASPACDLLYYIFCCTTKALRDKHYNDFLDVYYKSLSSFLTRLGSNPSKLFPQEVLNDHLKRFGKFGLCMAIFILPIITSNAEDTMDLDEMARKFKEASDNGAKLDVDAINASNPKTNEMYSNRVMGMFEDMYAMGLI